MGETSSQFADQPARSSRGPTPGSPRASTASAPAWAERLAVLQCQAGNAAVVAMVQSVQRDARLMPPTASPVHTVTLRPPSADKAEAPGPTVQRVRAFGSAPRGGGLTKETKVEYGTYHMHIIADSDGLGLVKSAFLKLTLSNPLRGEKRERSLYINGNGEVMETDFAKSAGKWALGRDEAQYGWALETLMAYLDANCTVISEAEVLERREAKAAQVGAAQAHVSSLPPAKVSGKAEDKAGHFPTSTATEEAAVKLLELAGHTPPQPGVRSDYVPLKRAVMSEKPKGEWPSYLQPYYDGIYSPR